MGSNPAKLNSRLHFCQPGVSRVLDVADADGQSVAVVVAKPAVVQRLRELLRFL